MDLLKNVSKQCNFKKVLFIFFVVFVLCSVSVFVLFDFFNMKKSNFNYFASSDETSFKKSNICASFATKPELRRRLTIENVTEVYVDSKLMRQGIKNGGCWSPKACIPKSHIAIIIPYRNREEHLKLFLLNMHPLFAKQLLSYCIYVIEPITGITFNRGILMNIGFVESNKDSNDLWQCHAYHDVDLLSENELTSYHCPNYPSHLAYKMSKFKYKPIYDSYFGGANIMKKEHFIKANGYSNLFFGWGGEDDDHANRIYHANLTIIKPKPNTTIGIYTMLSHQRDKPNPKSELLVKEGQFRFEIEGLNTLDYKIIDKNKYKYYTRYLVHYNETKIMRDFNKKLIMTNSTAKKIPV